MTVGHSHLIETQRDEETTVQDDDKNYWLVKLNVFAFESLQEAKAYEQALLDAFTAMPESAGYASSCCIRHASEDFGSLADRQVSHLKAALRRISKPSLKSCIIGGFDLRRIAREALLTMPSDTIRA